MRTGDGGDVVPDRNVSGCLRSGECPTLRLGICTSLYGLMFRCVGSAIGGFVCPGVEVPETKVLVVVAPPLVEVVGRV